MERIYSRDNVQPIITEVYVLNNNEQMNSMSLGKKDKRKRAQRHCDILAWKDDDVDLGLGCPAGTTVANSALVLFCIDGQTTNQGL